MSNANNSKTSFLAFATDDKDVATLKAFAALKGWEESCVHQGHIGAAAEYLKSNPSPTLLLVEVTSASEAPGQLDSLAEVCDPGTKVIVTGSVNEYSFYCWLMDLGISSYLLKPLKEEALAGAIDKAHAPKESAADDGKKKPATVIAVIGTRGGVGATSLCINLAGIIAKNSGKNTALVDLDAREGSVALALDLEPSRGFRESLEKPERIDSLFLDRVMTKVQDKLSILSAEESLQETLKIHEGASAALINQLKEAYDVLVLDVPRTLDPFSSKCLGAADHVVLATELSLLSLRDALRFKDVMREALKMKPPTVVALRTGLAPKHEVLKADFEKGIDSKIAHSVPYAPDIFMPIDMSIPAIKSKDHAAVKPLYDLAGELIPEAKMEDDKKSAKKGGLLSKKKK